MGDNAEISDNMKSSNNIEPLGLDEKLTITKNNLVDIINWLKRDAYVIIHAKNGRFFHKCSKKQLSEEERKTYINTNRFIYVDVSKMTGLLDDGEWEWFIKDSGKSMGIDECKCGLEYICDNPNVIPHKTMLSLKF
ncbi:Hypothetical protein HVR_LOCUS890 [uncultured virus]|nr:Hypothetical protein HVR_LOCUS890 [uncultured virus]